MQFLCQYTMNNLSHLTESHSAHQPSRSASYTLLARLKRIQIAVQINVQISCCCGKVSLQTTTGWEWWNTRKEQTEDVCSLSFFFVFLHHCFPGVCCFPSFTFLSPLPFHLFLFHSHIFLKACLFVWFFLSLFHVITGFAYSHNSYSLFFTDWLLCFTVTESIMEFICVTVKHNVGAIFLLSQEEYHPGVCLCLSRPLSESSEK